MVKSAKSVESENAAMGPSAPPSISRMAPNLRGVDPEDRRPNEIRAGPPAVFAIITDSAALARPTSGNNRKSRNLCDGVSSVRILFAVWAEYGRPQFGRNPDVRESGGRRITDILHFGVLLPNSGRANLAKRPNREHLPGAPSRILPTSRGSWWSPHVADANSADSVRRVEMLAPHYLFFGFRRFYGFYQIRVS